MRSAGRLDPAELDRVLTLVQTAEPDAADGDGDSEAEDPSLRRWIKTSAGDVSLKTMLDEVDKLKAIRAISGRARLATCIPGWRRP